MLGFSFITSTYGCLVWQEELGISLGLLMTGPVLQLIHSQVLLCSPNGFSQTWHHQRCYFPICFSPPQALVATSQVLVQTPVLQQVWQIPSQVSYLLKEALKASLRWRETNHQNTGLFYELCPGNKLGFMCHSCTSPIWWWSVTFVIFATHSMLIIAHWFSYLPIGQVEVPTPQQPSDKWQPTFTFLRLMLWPLSRPMPPRSFVSMALLMCHYKLLNKAMMHMYSSNIYWAPIEEGDDHLCS